MHTNGNYNNNVVSSDHDQPDNNCIRGMQHGCVNVTNIVEDLKTGKCWSMFKLIKSPGDGHCLMHSVVNSLNVTNTNNANISLLLKQLTEETVDNAHRYIDFIDGNGIF